jgi:Neuraminidase (sialidase)
MRPELKEDVFVNYDNLWFRTPVLVTTKSGRLIAFAERTVADYSHGHDLGPSLPSLVLRSSDDGGASWGNLTVAYDGGASWGTEAGHAITGATPVVDLESGDVHLLFTRDGREIHAITSQDDGETWSPPTDHSATLVGELSWAGTGPGAGTQLPGGRLVAAARVCCNHDSDVFDVFAVYSDDRGVTWRRGHAVSLGDTSSLREGQVAQLGNGELAMVLSATPEKGSGQMAVAVSSDHGETWAIPARMAPFIGLNYQYPVASLGGTDGGLLVADESYLYTLDSLGGTEPTWRYFVPAEHIGWSSVAYNSFGPMMLYESMIYERITFVAGFGHTSEMDMVV